MIAAAAEHMRIFQRLVFLGHREDNDLGPLAEIFDHIELQLGFQLPEHAITTDLARCDRPQRGLVGGIPAARFIATAGGELSWAS
jgi:hypothetical protein